ncbi:MAG TPA: DUF4189 domain-containing protein [bacterium]|nr:DUF4189 domain-containing protein [bacterium]
MGKLLKRMCLFVYLMAGFTMALAYDSAFAGMDCYRDCMDASSCWSARSGENVSYCSSTQARCSSDCRNQGNSNQRSYGAIAYNAKSGAYGYSNSWEDRKKAEQTALKYCKQYGSGCKSEVWFYNSCGAVAADGRKVAWGRADSAREANRQALEKCNKGFFKKHCEVKVSHCSW